MLASRSSLVRETSIFMLLAVNTLSSIFTARFTHRLASLTASLRSPLVIETFSKDSLTGIEDFTDEGKTSSNNPPLTIEDINVVVPAEGIFLTMNALLEEGDEVVVAMPCYQVRRRCNSCSSH